MGGCNAPPDAKAGRGKRGDELGCARLQLETGHENHRPPPLDEGANGLGRLLPVANRADLLARFKNK